MTSSQETERVYSHNPGACTGARFFYRPDALTVTQPTLSKHWRDFSARYNNNSKKFHSRLMAVLQDNPGKAVPECHYSGFHWSKDVGGCSDNWSYKTCKALVKTRGLSSLSWPLKAPLWESHQASCQPSDASTPTQGKMQHGKNNQ